MRAPVPRLFTWIICFVPDGVEENARAEGVDGAGPRACARRTGGSATRATMIGMTKNIWFVFLVSRCIPHISG